MAKILKNYSLGSQSTPVWMRYFMQQLISKGQLSKIVAIHSSLDALFYEAYTEMIDSLTN